MWCLKEELESVVLVDYVQFGWGPEKELRTQYLLGTHVTL